MLIKQNDELLKGVLEKYFSEFLRFLYSRADCLFDLQHKIDFLDKELLLLAPDRLRNQGKRIADMLAKVRLKEGPECWMMIHTEIEGGSQHNFPLRLLQYHYRFMDKHQVPIETIVLFTGDKQQKRKTHYERIGVFSSLKFSVHSYHIWENSEFELLQMDNIFALVVLACQKAFKEGKVSDEELGKDRLVIAKAMLQQKHSHQEARSFLVFLKNFLYVSSQEINDEFDLILNELTEGGIRMEIIDIVKKHAAERAFKRGKREGKKEGRVEGHEEARREFFFFIRAMKERGVTVEEIANLTKLSVVEIEKLLVV